MKTFQTAWYCARTKSKHEHIAAANLRKNLELEVFLPRLRIERATQRGVVRLIEPLFPCYLFVQCVMEDRMEEIKHTNGISSLVGFGPNIPTVPALIIAELREYFSADELLTVENELSPGDEVRMTDGVFAGMGAFVLRNMPARERVQVLLNILGRPTMVETDRAGVTLVNNSIARLVPTLAVSPRETIRR